MTEVLWTAATARSIVADIVCDMELGRMSRAAGLDLIRRVRERAAPEPEGSSPARKATSGPFALLGAGAGDSMRA